MSCDSISLKSPRLRVNSKERTACTQPQSIHDEQRCVRTSQLSSTPQNRYRRYERLTTLNATSQQCHLMLSTPGAFRRASGQPHTRSAPTTHAPPPSLSMSSDPALSKEVQQIVPKHIAEDYQHKCNETGYRNDPEEREGMSTLR